MAPETVTQDRIYRAVLLDILDSRFEPHSRIDIQRIAERHGASPTPVREALYRLMGETVIEPHPDGGFRLALPDVIGLINLYKWIEELLLSALHLAKPDAVRKAIRDTAFASVAAGPAEVAIAISATFEAIAGAAGNPEFVVAVRRANHRLHCFRLAEAKLLADLPGELRTFFRNGAIDVRTNVRRRVRQYHRRRVFQAIELHALVDRIS